MNGGIDRNMVAEFIVLIAVCIGSWIIFVAPKVGELKELRVSITEAEQNPVLQDRVRIEKMASGMGDIRKRMRFIDRQNTFGRDSSQMYGIIMDLAKAHDVSIGQLDPGSSARAGDPAAAMQIVQFNMGVQGKYRQVAGFLDAVADLNGFVRPVSLTLTPKGAEGSALVEARFACEALCFRVPDVLASLVGDNDADE